jgi:tetratricopeptide (TPR) repeat protein
LDHPPKRPPGTGAGAWTPPRSLVSSAAAPAAPPDDETAEVRETLALLGRMSPEDADLTVVELLEAALCGEVSLWQLLGYTPEQLYDIYSKAHFLYKGGRPKNAAVLLEGYLALEPRSMEARLLLAACCYELQQYDRSLELVEALLRDEPENLGGLLRKAMLLQRARRLVDAGLLYQKVIALDAGAGSAPAQTAARSLAQMHEHFGS